MSGLPETGQGRAIYGRYGDARLTARRLRLVWFAPAKIFQCSNSASVLDHSAGLVVQNSRSRGRDRQRLPICPSLEQSSSAIVVTEKDGRGGPRHVKRGRPS